MSSSIPSWQILTAHAQPFRGARDLAFCLKVPLDSLLVWASSGGSGETARMRRLAWTFAARIGDKYQIRLTRPISGAVSYPNHTVPGQASLAVYQYLVHILSPVIDNCSSWISGRERMAKSPWKNVPNVGIELGGPLACQADTLLIEQPRPAQKNRTDKVGIWW